MVKYLGKNDRYDSMRGWFAWDLHRHMIDNKDIWVITADMGYGMFDKIQRDFPNRFVNVGVAEQAMMGIAVGLALEGKIPFVYSLTPFLLFRPFEIIRIYINHEKIPVKMIGSGRKKDYLKDGFTHWAHEDKPLMKMFPNIKCYWPEKKEEIPSLLKKIISNRLPVYLNLIR